MRIIVNYKNIEGWIWKRKRMLVQRQVTKTMLTSLTFWLKLNGNCFVLFCFMLFVAIASFILWFSWCVLVCFFSLSSFARSFHILFLLVCVSPPISIYSPFYHAFTQAHLRKPNKRHIVGELNVCSNDQASEKLVFCYIVCLSISWFSSSHFAPFNTLDSVVIEMF